MAHATTYTIDEGGNHRNNRRRAVLPLRPSWDCSGRHNFGLLCGYSMTERQTHATNQLFNRDVGLNDGFSCLVWESEVNFILAHSKKNPKRTSGEK